MVMCWSVTFWRMASSGSVVADLVRVAARALLSPPPRLVTRKMASRAMTAEPAKAATFTPPGSRRRGPPLGRRGRPAAGRPSGPPVSCGRARPDGLGVLMLIAVLPEVDPIDFARAGTPPADLPEGPPGQQPRRRRPAAR